MAEIKPGNRFGHLIVVSKDDSVKQGHAYWRCSCEACGRETRVRSSYLRSGKTRSCSCLRGGTRTGAGGAAVVRASPEKAPDYKLLKNGVKIAGVYIPRATLMEIVRKFLAMDHGK